MWSRENESRFHYLWLLVVSFTAHCIKKFISINYFCCVPLPDLQKYLALKQRYLCKKYRDFDPKVIEAKREICFIGFLILVLKKTIFQIY